MRGAAALGATPAKDGVRPVRLLIAPGRETRRGKGQRLSSDAFRVTHAGIGGSRPISLETSVERSSDATSYVEAGVLADYAGSFVLRPGAGGGTQPDMRHTNSSIRLPCSNRVRLHVMMAPVADNSARRWRTFAIGTPVSLASSESRR